MSDLKSAAIEGAQTGAAVAMGASMKAAEALFSAGFSKMKLKSYALIVQSGGEVKTDKKEAIDVVINPESYQRSFSGSTAGNKKGGSRNPLTLADGKVRTQKVVQFSETLSFELWFDSTGIFPDCKDVAESIDELKENLVDYKGDIHSARYVHIIWGDLDFMGQVQSMSVDYLFFNRDGKPLRAKVKLSFTELLDANIKSLMEDDQSPDLTHSRIVKDGDTLPLMCYHIYNDPFYYPQVAAANGLADFTDLKPGQRLFFPPLER